MSADNCGITADMAQAALGKLRGHRDESPTMRLARMYRAEHESCRIVTFTADVPGVTPVYLDARCGLCKEFDLTSGE